MSGEVVQGSIEAENGAERVKSPQPNQSDIGEKIDVRRRRIGVVTIYDVTETELMILEKGTDSSVWLNFFIGAISMAVSFLVSLLTVDWGYDISLTQVVFICVTIIMFLTSIVCFVFWRIGRRQHKSTIKTIKERTLQDNCL